MTVDNRIYSNIKTFNFKQIFDITNNIIYTLNNWYTPNNLQENKILTDINKRNFAIWLTVKGDVYYRLAPYMEVYTAPISKINVVLTSLLGYSVEITKRAKKVSLISQKPISDINQRGMYIRVEELLLVYSEGFNPHEGKEFYLVGNVTCRNTFFPSVYMYNQPNKNHKYDDSITIQYIYYLANYDKSRFEYIMTWLAAFFKNLSNRSHIALIFLGKKDSGKEIIFDEIIKPLFGEEYCIKINDEILETKNLSKIIKNKLFYNLDNISSTVVEEKKLKRTIKNFIVNDTMYADDNRDSLQEIKIFGQTLITIDEPNLSYINTNDENYTIFKVPDNIENIIIYEEKYDRTREKLTKQKLIKEIKDDLKNFALLLKSYKVDFNQSNMSFKDDDKECIQNNLEDKLNTFHNAIIKMNRSYFEPIEKDNSTLYKQLMKDFDQNKINQQNLFKCFNLLYNEEDISHPRTLMAKLRKIKDNIFETKFN